MPNTGRRKVNLLNEGTGIRFDLKSKGVSIQKSKQFRFLLGLAALSLLAFLSFTVGGMMLDFLDFRERSAKRDEGGVAPGVGKRTSEKADSKTGGDSPSGDEAGVTAFNVRPKVPTKKGATDAESPEGEGEGEEEETVEYIYQVRYALFLSRENAEAYSVKLNQNALLAEVLETEYPLPSYTIKAGPFVNPNSRKVTQKELKKLGVALTPFIEQKYLVSKPVWKKSKALEIQKRLLSIGVSTELSMERSPKTVFKVVTSPFDDRKEAEEYAEIAKEDGLKVIVEEIEKVIDDAEGMDADVEADGEEKGVEPEENGEKQQE